MSTGTTAALSAVRVTLLAGVSAAALSLSVGDVYAQNLTCLNVPPPPGPLTTGGSGTNVIGTGNHACGIDTGNFVAGIGNGSSGVASGNFVAGIGNTATGAGSGNIVAGIANTATGAGSGNVVAGGGNTATGVLTGNGVLGFANTSTGAASGNGILGVANTSTGTASGNGILGFANTTAGTASGNGILGVANTSNGFTSGNNVFGSGNNAVGSGSGNNLGDLSTLTTANNNNALGNNSGNNIAGSNNSAVGNNSGNNVTGSGNSVLGNNAGNRQQINDTVSKATEQSQQGNDQVDAEQWPNSDFKWTHADQRELVSAPGNNVDMGGNRIQDVGTPIFATDAANKAYVDRGLNKASRVRLSRLRSLSRSWAPARTSQSASAGVNMRARTQAVSAPWVSLDATGSGAAPRLRSTAALAGATTTPLQQKLASRSALAPPWRPTLR